jgi:hypothetical protein
MLRANVGRLEELAKGDTYVWFTMQARPEHAVDGLGPFKYVNLKMAEFTVDRTMVWERYGGGCNGEVRGR